MTTFVHLLQYPQNHLGCFGAMHCKLFTDSRVRLQRGSINLNLSVLASWSTVILIAKIEVANLTSVSERDFYSESLWWYLKPKKNLFFSGIPTWAAAT